MAKERKSKSTLDKLKSKYRLVILNDETFEEQTSFRLSRFNIYLIVSTLSLLLIFITGSIIVFTPVKHYVPGYAELDKLRSDVVSLKFRTDSLERIVIERNLWIQNLKQVLEGKADSIAGTSYEFYESESDKQVIEADPTSSMQFVPSFKQKQFRLFKPLDGHLTAKFQPQKEHFGIDMVAEAEAPIRSVADGTVVLSSWTLKTGYVMAIQHRNNLISLYKHNSTLFKKVGSFVEAGEVIALIGDGGELSSGPHLHVEIWQEGRALNPEDHLFLN